MLTAVISIRWLKKQIASDEFFSSAENTSSKSCVWSKMSREQSKSAWRLVFRCQDEKSSLLSFDRSVWLIAWTRKANATSGLFCERKPLIFFCSLFDVIHLAISFSLTFPRSRWFFLFMLVSLELLERFSRLSIGEREKDRINEASRTTQSTVNKHQGDVGVSQGLFVECRTSFR